MRKLISAVAGAAMLASSTVAFADSPATQGQPLAPGGAAGVQNAQATYVAPWFWVGTFFAVAAVTTVIVLNNTHSSTGTH